MTVSARPRTVLACLAVLLAVHPASSQSASYTFAVFAGAPFTDSYAEGTGSAARFASPSGIAIGPSGELYVADTGNHVVRRITPAGVVTRLAGAHGTHGSTDGPADVARFYSPRGIAVDGAGSVYVADTGNSTIRRISAAGEVSTLAGLPRIVGSADGTGAGARFNAPMGLAIDAGGRLYVADTGNHTIRSVTSAGAVTTLAGLGGGQGAADGPANAARFRSPQGLAVSGGVLYVADTGNHTIRTVSGGTVATLAGSAQSPGQTNATGASARFAAPTGIVVTASATYVSEAGNHRVRAIDSSAAVTTLAGSNAGALDGTGTSALFRAPQGLVADTSGQLFVADAGNHVIRQVTPAGAVTTFAGSLGAGTGSTAGTIDGMGTTARFAFPFDVALDSAGNAYVTQASVVRRITPAGVVTTLAGSASASGSTDGAGSAARFNDLRGIVVAGDGTIYVSDFGNRTIRAITPSGVVTTYAGTAGTFGSADGTGAAASFRGPDGLTSDAAGNLYVADSPSCTIRRIAPGAVVTTYVGQGPATCPSGAFDATGTNARFAFPNDVVSLADGTLFVADTSNNMIRKVAAGGVVTTFAGSGTFGDEDGAPGVAQFRAPGGIAVHSDGTLFVTELSGHVIRRVSATGTVTTIGGTPLVAGARDGTGAQALFTSPRGIAVASDGTLYIADRSNHVIRIGSTALTIAPAITTHPQTATVGAGQTTTFAIAATGVPAPSIQWQRSTDNGSTWGNVADTSPHSGTTTTTLTVGSASVAQHGHLYRATVTNGGGAATSLPAMLRVVQVTVSPSPLRFGATKAGPTGGLTAVTAPQELTVQFHGVTGLAWTASSSATWLQLSGAAGAGSGRFTAAVVNPGNVIGASTNLTATISVTAAGASNSPVIVPVTLAVDQTNSSTEGPAGQIDTPTVNETVQGTINLTGWVVDDVGVASVKAYRACVATDAPGACQRVSYGVFFGASFSANDMVYIGDAAILPGARPDIEPAFPNVPAANKAGWGLQVLTNLLPRTAAPAAASGGQGSLRLFVIATDLEGNRSGFSTSWSQPFGDGVPINMANDTIARPFGAIDTPAPAATVSGTIPNFGWALTPDTNNDGTMIPTDGSTMKVFIDGLASGFVTYNQCRGTVGNPVPSGTFCNDDVSNLFGSDPPRPVFTPRAGNPSRFRNLDAARGPIGSFMLDTTVLSNGMHTLAWGVIDSAGRPEGIGSRFFTVLNSGIRPGSDVARALRAAPAEARADAASIAAWPRADRTLRGRTGYDLTTALAPLADDAAGVAAAQLPVGGRLELDLDGPVTAGYLSANGTLRDLPPGSRLDAGSGTFTWTPAPGYLGTYRLVFLSGQTQAAVDVHVRAAGVARDDEAQIRMAIDTPVDSTATGSTVSILGWALDPDAWTGSGIDTVHVWAWRRDAPSLPQFLGAATMGLARPDVAAAHGAPHLRSGFGLVTGQLEAGDYEIVVYAFCARTGRWEDARAVRVTAR